MRASSSGPISETVVRTGCPCSPKRSQKIDRAGLRTAVASSPSCSRRSLDLPARRRRLTDAREVALDVGHEDRHADGREAFGQHLQR